MRWTKEKQPVITDFRAIKRFAFFPIKCKNEYRWLETCYVLQERWYSWGETGWSNIAWTNEETYEAWKKHTTWEEREEAWIKETQ